MMMAGRSQQGTSFGGATTATATATTQSNTPPVLAATDGPKTRNGPAPITADLADLDKALEAFSDIPPTKPEWTPTDKLRFDNGAFTPTHKNHIEMLEMAAAFLRDTGIFNPVGAYLSPSSQEYVSKKLKELSVPLEERIEMCKLAVQNNNLIMADQWECRQPKHVDAVAVGKHLFCFINEYARKNNIDTYGKPIQVMMVMGGDLLVRMLEIHELLSLFYAAVVQRQDLEEIIGVRKKLKEEVPDLAERLFFLPQKYLATQVPNLSSTLIRTKLTHGEPVDELVPTPLAHYIEDNRLWTPAERQQKRENTKKP